MVELGLAYGGSLAWFALRGRPTTLVGIEYKANRIPHLDRFIESRDLGAVVRPYYGVDQADGDRLREIVAAEFRGEPIDLVVDDASHRYGATLASFETLFPLMRPGGLYVIEDWAGLHEQAALFERTLAQGRPGRPSDWRRGSPSGSSRAPVPRRRCRGWRSSSCWCRRPSRR